MFFKGAFICLLAIWIEIDAAKKGKFLKKLAKPNELGYKLENAVKSNLKDDVSANNASISALLDKFNSLQADCNATTTTIQEDISILMDKHDSLQAEYNDSTTTNQEDISTLMDRLDSLQSDYISLRADYNVLKAGIEANNNKIQTNAEGILANTNLNNTLADSIASNLAKFTSITADISNIDTTLGSRLLDLETMGSGSVWFDAVRTSNFDGSGDWTKITYSYYYASSSYAGSMDVGTGVFTAPLAGTYQFFIQVQTPPVSSLQSAGGSSSVRISMEGSIVSYIYDGDTSNRGTITGTAIVDMQLGQKVWADTVRLLYGNSWSPIHFTGVLINPK